MTIERFIVLYRASQVINRRNSYNLNTANNRQICNKKKLDLRTDMKMCTWNVNTMAQAGKIYNAAQEMAR